MKNIGCLVSTKGLSPMKTILATLVIAIIAICGCTQVAFAADNDSPPRDEDRTYSSLNRELDRALEWVNEAPNTELDRVTALHEYICLNYDYDNGDQNSISEGGSVLATRKGICASYSGLFDYLIDGIGIAGVEVSGLPTEQSFYEDAHSWNVVKIDGEWYFLDTTWDGYSDIAGKCLFNNFLRSKFTDPHRADFENGNYSEWLTKCTSTRFDDYWWFQTTGMEALARDCVPIPYDGAWYYVNGNYQIVKRTSVAEDSEVTVLRDSGQDGIYIGNHIVIKDGQLFFMGNTSGADGQSCHDIYQVDIDTNSEPVKVFTADGDFSYFGMKSNIIYYNVSGEENIPISIPEGYVPPSEITVTQEKVKYGDFVESIHFSAEVSPANATNKNVDWDYTEYCGAIDKNGNWRAVQCSINPKSDYVNAFTEDGTVYKAIHVTIPYAEGIGDIPSVFITHDTEGNHGLFWPTAKNATKYAVFRWHYYPYNSEQTKATEMVAEWIGETTENFFALDDDMYNKEYVYGVTPVNYSGMGTVHNTNLNTNDYGPLSVREEIIDYPHNVEYEQVCKGTLRFTWDEVEGADGYTCSYLEADSAQEHEDFQWVTVSDEQAIVTGLKENKDYLFFINAGNSNSAADSYGVAFLRIHVNEMTCKPYLTKTEAVPARCEFNGNEEYYTCEICGAYYSDPEGANEIEKDSWITQYLNHDPGEMYIEEGVEATCDMEGYYYECIKCNRCGEYLRRGRITTARLPHQLEHVDIVEPTCSGGGEKEHWHCSECGGTFADEAGTEPISIHIPPLGHDMEHFEAKDATCTEDGNIEYWHCKRCDLYFRTEDASLGYAENGLMIIKATGHTEQVIEGKEPTCIGTGLTVGKKCSVCNEVLQEQEEIPANGHSWDEGTVTTKPTCSKEGVKTFTCTKCDATRTEPIEINANAHTPAEAVQENLVDATCTADGSFDEVTYCKDCNAELSRESKTIPATHHENTIEHIASQEATCLEPGNNEYWHCSKCGGYFSDANASEQIEENSWIIPAKGHLWDEGVTTEAGCVTGGSILYTCERCGDTNLVATDPKGHTPGEAVQENILNATCTSDGSYDEIVRCAVCDAELSKETKTTPATHHENTMEYTAAKAVTCTAGGNSEYWYCTACGLYFSSEDGSEPIEENSWILTAPGHKWNTKYTVDKKATYAAKGSKSIHCSICNVKKAGSAVAILKLVVKATTLSKLTPAKRAITVKWKKGGSITGYQIQYALNSKFTSGKKTVKITKSGTVSKKITKLKAKKKYYVRVRTYKTVSGKTYYSKWSKYKYTKTK